MIFSTAYNAWSNIKLRMMNLFQILTPLFKINSDQIVNEIVLILGGGFEGLLVHNKSENTKSNLIIITLFINKAENG